MNIFKNKKKCSGLFLLIFILSFVLGIANFPSTKASNATAKNEASVLKFVHISDAHVDSKSKDSTRRLYSSSRKLLQDAVEQINSINDIDVVVFSGDSINKPVESDLIKFIAIANKLKYPWHASTGNHEIGIKGGLSKNKRLELLNKYNKNFNSDKSYYSFSPKKGYLIIVMDGVIDWRVTANGYYHKQELEWLDQQLKNNKDSKVIIVQHFPVVEPFKSESHKINNAGEYSQVLNKHNNVIAVLSGHYHAAKVNKVGNTVHVSTPALVEYPNAFRVITIIDKENQIQINFDFRETRLKNLQQKSKSLSKSWQLSQGKDTDRNTTIILNK
ncbi:MAG: hypothetical protein ACD_20C00051G0012 [uncultured bacterium]|nr:MAG: hypothetical protein ACD_20C00051G0012 [uncultured bacterium]HBH18173.1 hypothetical protein [Cyanobacteria bacterium UBA9579]